MSVVDDLKSQISAKRIIFDPGKEARLQQELLGENPTGVKVTENLQKLVLQLSKIIDSSKQIRISDLIRTSGSDSHHKAGRAVDIGNEEIADHLLRVKEVATDAFVRDWKIDEIIFKASGTTPAEHNRWNYDDGKKATYDAKTLNEHANHIHLAVNS